MEDILKCELCGRAGSSQYYEKHHLFPGEKKRKKKEDPRYLQTITVDTACGDQIHLMFDNSKLFNELNTAEKLKEAMATFIEFIQKKPLDSNIHMKTLKRR
jgi:hypothetical protein